MFIVWGSVLLVVLKGWVLNHKLLDLFLFANLNSYALIFIFIVIYCGLLFKSMHFTFRFSHHVLFVQLVLRV